MGLSFSNAGTTKITIQCDRAPVSRASSVLALTSCPLGTLRLRGVPVVFEANRLDAGTGGFHLTANIIQGGVRYLHPGRHLYACLPSREFVATASTCQSLLSTSAVETQTFAPEVDGVVVAAPVCHFTVMAVLEDSAADHLAACAPGFTGCDCQTPTPLSSLNANAGFTGFIGAACGLFLAGICVFTWRFATCRRGGVLFSVEEVGANVCLYVGLVCVIAARSFYTQGPLDQHSYIGTSTSLTFAYAFALAIGPALAVAVTLATHGSGDAHACLELCGDATDEQELDHGIELGAFLGGEGQQRQHRAEAIGRDRYESKWCTETRLVGILASMFFLLSPLTTTMMAIGGCVVVVCSVRVHFTRHIPVPTLFAIDAVLPICVAAYGLYEVCLPPCYHSGTVNL